MISPHSIDIVIPQLAEKGGMDKVINQFVLFMQDDADQTQNEPIKVRIIQCVDTGLMWWDPSVKVVNLYSANDNPNFAAAAVKYGEYIKETYMPDIILATGWPVTITIVAKALETIGASDIPVFAWPHMMFFEAEYNGVGNIGCLRDADAVFAISKQLENEVNNSGMDIPIIRINNPIDTPEYTRESNNTSCLRPMKLLYVGRLVDYKNLSLIFHALSLTKHEWTLRVVGDGEMQKTKESCAGFGVTDRVVFDGFKSNPWECTDDVDFCIVSSDYEGFCLVIPEALSRGIPVLTTPVGVATEIIKNGINGYLYGIKDYSMLAQVLDMIYEGALPIPDAKPCIESAKPYEINNVLSDFRDKIIKAYDNYISASTSSKSSAVSTS